MKYCLIVLAFLSVTSFAQTTELEYNYATKGYRTSLEQGLDIKKGYKIEQVGESYKEGNYSFEFLALIRETSNEKACYILHAKSSVWGAEYFFCLPINNKLLLDQFQKDIGSWDKTMLTDYSMFVSMHLATTGK